MGGILSAVAFACLYNFFFKWGKFKRGGICMFAYFYAGSDILSAVAFACLCSMFLKGGISAVKFACPCIFFVSFQRENIIAIF